MKIPPNLISQIAEGKAVLFLGAGASVGTTDSQGRPAPDTKELTRKLSDKFLGGSHQAAALNVVAELAISENDLFTVQEFIRTQFEDVRPASFHELMATFRWTGVATTNFDLVIERAYENYGKRVQTLVPMIKNGDRVEERLQSSRGVMLLKLHGCITRTADADVPLILTTDQYITHRENRERVFDHLRNWAYEHAVVFVGQSLQDSDIRSMLLELGKLDERPRYYTVTPSLSEEERRLWEGRRISPLEGTFEDFLQTLDAEISTPFRGVGSADVEVDLPIAERFAVTDPGLSERCRVFLSDDVEYVRVPMPTTSLDARDFYRGFPGGWSAIEQGLDVRRKLGETILSDVMLGDYSGAQLHVVKGEAGAGKSVLLRRIAWDAGTEFGKLCLFVRPHGRLSFDSIREIVQVTKERVHLFVDRASERVRELRDVIERSKRADLEVTIVTAERYSEWNMSCESLAPYVTEEHEIRYLSRSEIEQLVSLLDAHRSLGYLEDAPHDARIKAFEIKAGRQLLVALHEATLGRPFEEIIHDEYLELQPAQAQAIYLGICTLNRFGVPVRAGVIARVYGVRFTQFKEKFFRPLERVVLSSRDERSQDYVYTARHQHIAEIVFECSVSSPAQRLDLYRQLLSALNVDYDADRSAMRGLVRAREVITLFPDHNMAASVYDAALAAAGEDAYVIHQKAIYEMRRVNGNFQEAEDLLRHAKRLAPYDKTIVHSMAELSLIRAERSDSGLEFETHAREAKKLALVNTGPRAVSAHGYHTLAKVSLARLQRLLKQGEEDISDSEVGALIKDSSDAIGQGLQMFPEEPYLLDAEARLGELVADNDKAISALRRAFKADQLSPYAVTRLANYLVQAGQSEEACSVYERSLESGAQDRRIHFGYAKLLLELEGDGAKAEYHLRRSFTKGDRNFEAQFWYGRQVYISGKIDEAKELYQVLGDAPVDPRVKRMVRGTVTANGTEVRSTGRIERLESSYALVSRDGPGDWVFLHISNATKQLWSELRVGVRLSFALGFTFKGAAVTRPKLETGDSGS